MGLSLIPRQQPEQRLHTVTIDEILSLGERLDGDKPRLEQYFSPGRRTAFEKDFLRFLNDSLLRTKHGELDLDLYLVFILTFQFIAPLLEIPAEKELGIFFRILEERYDVEDLDINMHFATGEFENTGGAILEIEKGMLAEDEVMLGFTQELDASYEGRREVKEAVQKRLKQDGIRAIMKWQERTGLPDLAEAFGRSIVIPAFFSFTDKKLVGFYRRATEGIRYEVAVPEFEEEEN
jgi:hypothetical protein